MRRVAEFDALRALAALGVLLYHLQDKQGTWTHFGYTGVHLFLVLSGYLITGIVIRHVDSPNFFQAFYARRVLRIWPIYFLTLGFLVVYQRYVAPHPPSLRGIVYFLTFTQYTWAWPGAAGLLFRPPNGPVHAFEHSWTLAVEEQFYLVWPLAIALVGRKRLVPMIGAILVFGVWFKTQGMMLQDRSWILLNVIGAFALGGLIAAILQDQGRAARYRPLLSIGFIASSLAGFAYLRWYYTTPPPGWMSAVELYRHSLQNFAFYAIHFGIVGFVATNAGAWFLAPLRLKELTFVGEISYGMYLYHVPVYWLINGSGVQPSGEWPMWVAKIAVTFVVATLSYRYIELPILRLKDWFPYEKQGKRVEVVSPAPNAAIRPPHLISSRPASIDQSPTRTNADHSSS